MPMAGTWITELRQPSGQLWSVAEQLFEAIDFMHQHGVAHMDLKPANILIPLRGGRLSIIDFNTSVRVKGVKDMFRGVVGTPGYIAPEVEDDGDPYSAIRADLWSCGKVLYELCKICQPSTDRDVLLGIAGQLMDEDPQKRPMMSDVLEMMAQYKADADTGMDCVRYSGRFCVHVTRAYSWQIFLCWSTGGERMSWTSEAYHVILYFQYQSLHVIPAPRSLFCTSRYCSCTKSIAT